MKNISNIEKPIQEWIDTCYKAISLVSHEGIVYLSRKDVPKHISLNNSEYWVRFGKISGWITQQKLEEAISTLREIISPYATSDNYVVDKAFVNSSIATNTANFKGTYNVVTDLGLEYGANVEDIAEALLEKTAESVTNNDYVFVINKDINNKDNNDNTIFQRFKFTTTYNWLYEFSLNNSSFTAQQWANINATPVECKFEVEGETDPVIYNFLNIES